MVILFEFLFELLKSDICMCFLVLVLRVVEVLLRMSKFGFFSRV